jgi:uncharacterized protein
MDDVISHEDYGRGGIFFVMRNGIRVAEMTYHRTGEQVVVIDHTEVDEVLRGRGVARKLLDAAVAWARATDTMIIPSCSYVTLQFARDASIRDVLA